MPKKPTAKAKKPTAKDLVIEELSRKVEILENKLFLQTEKNKRLQGRLKPFLKKEKLEREEIIKKDKAEKLLARALEVKKLARDKKIKSINNEIRAIKREIRVADQEDEEVMAAFHDLIEEKEQSIRDLLEEK